MPRRTKEELKIELERLASIFQMIIDFQNNEMPEIAAYHADVQTKDEILGRVASGKSTLSEMISGVQMAINDFQMGLSDFKEESHYLLSPSERGPNAKKFFAFYRERTGRDFYQDVVDPKQIARTIMKRGQSRLRLSTMSLSSL